MRARLKRDEILLDVDPDRLDRPPLPPPPARPLGAAGAGHRHPVRRLRAARMDRRPLPPTSVSSARSCCCPSRLDRARSVDPYTLTPLDERPILNPALAFQLQQAFQITLTPPPADDDGDLDYEAALGAPPGAARASARTGPSATARTSGCSRSPSRRCTPIWRPPATAWRSTPSCGRWPASPTACPPRPCPRPTAWTSASTPARRSRCSTPTPASGPSWPPSAPGSNLVVQGPPGTGKSQTIANAIAEALARGKSVLFVSEKLAALQVVAKRLRAAGLGEFCLEAHGHGGDKAAIVKALAVSPARRAAPPRRPADRRASAPRRAPRRPQRLRPCPPRRRQSRSAPRRSRSTASLRSAPPRPASSSISRPSAR